jgi:hydrogenase maturation protein HypF
LAQHAGLERVVMSGGCFQNVTLLEQSVAQLRAAGFRVYWPQRVPAGDGGIAVGQALAGLLGFGEKPASAGARESSAGAGCDGN